MVLRVELQKIFRPQLAGAKPILPPEVVLFQGVIHVYEEM
jgi:hypothetical protein